MHIEVRFDGTTPRQWHVRLLQRLALRPNCVATIDDRPGPGRLPPNAELLFSLEKRLHGLPRPAAAAPADAAALDPYRHAGGPIDLVLDLCGDIANDQARVWVLDFGGVSGEWGLLSSLLARRAPVATIRQSGGTVIATGRLGTEAGGIAFAGFDECLSRTITLILAALDGAATATLPTAEDEPIPPAREDPLSVAQLARRSGSIIAGAALRRLYMLLFHAPHWRVGWRKIDGDADLFALRGHPSSGWLEMPDDGSRFYADPFPIEYQGTVTLFVEDFVHATGKGIISAVAFGPDGPLGRPEPVLDLAYHLSYPFVFEREGSVWMIPESCAAGTIDLYRATAFPRGWVKEATLVENVVASDSTLHHRDGRWWMFATVKDEGGTYSDNLHLWSADDFKGPWRPHPRNPVLIDIASARPAGRIVERDGMMLRPVQDGRRGYGAALGIARVLQLDDWGFAQTVETVHNAGAGWPGRRLHTVNSAGGFEFIDGSSTARKRLPTLFQRRAANVGIVKPDRI